MDPAPPELAALLAACRARPADDLPRLVLADWLDENGQPERAEFVRVQVELSHKSADARRAAELKARESALIGTHCGAWGGGWGEVLAELPHPAPDAPVPVPFTVAVDRLFLPWRKDWSDSWEYPRGLLTLAHARRPDLLNHEVMLAWLRSSAGAWLERVNLSFGPEAFVKADLPDELHGKISLKLELDALGSHQAVTRQGRLLALSSNYTALRSLETDGLNGLAIVEQVANAEVSHLVQLTMPCGSAAERAASHIASAPFTSLSSLDLGKLTEPGLHALIRSPHLGNLTELNLVGSPIGDAGMVALCGSRLANTLRAVEFPNTGIGDAGVIALARSPLLAQMHGPRLNLMMNRIGSAGLKALAESEHLLRFRELVLRENAVGDAGVIALAESPFAANLQYLDFWRNRITDRGAFALARSLYLNKVADLSLKENAVTEAGAAALRERFGEAAKV